MAHIIQSNTEKPSTDTLHALELSVMQVAQLNDVLIHFVDLIGQGQDQEERACFIAYELETATKALVEVFQSHFREICNHRRAA